MKRVAFIAVIGTLSLIVASCSSASEHRTTADGKDVVKVGVVPVTDIAPLHLGIEQGYFAEENLEIETVSGKGGPELIAGVTSENLDIGISASTPLVQARANRLPVTAIAPISATMPEGEKGGRSALVAAKGSRIRDISDLEGTTIAVNGLKSINELLVRAAVDAKGADSTKLKFIELPFPDMAAALEAGRADAVATTEPFLSSMVEEGGQVLTYYMEEAKGRGVPATFWFTSRQQFENNTKLFQAFVRAWDKAVDYAEANPDDVRRILTTYTKLSAEQVEAMTLPNFRGESSQRLFQQDAELMVKYGFIDSAPDLDGIVP